MKDDQIIVCIDCIICMWHKYQKFKEHVNTLSLTYEEKNDLIYDFKLMFSTRNEEKCVFILKMFGH